MEGNGFGLVDTLTGNYFPVMTPGGYCDHKLAWSPTETAFVGRMCMDPGMFASAGDITKETVNLSAKFGKQDKYFSEISYSPDGKKLAFLSGQDIAPKLNEVGIANTDGTNYAVAEEPNYNQLPFFSKNGKELYYIQARGDKRVLMRHSWEVKATEDFAVLPEEFTEWRNPNWTEEGYLVLEGLMPNSNYGWAGSRLMILDMQNKKIIYLTPIFSGFTAYAGWAN